MRLPILCLLVAMSPTVRGVSVGSPAPHPTAPAPFWQGLGPGPYAVGYRVIYEDDEKRAWLSPPSNSDPGRPVRVSVWYPAAAETATQVMTYGDYLHHNAPVGFGAITEKLDQSDLASWKSDMESLVPNDKQALQRVLALPVAARADAAPLQGRHPLVLYVGGKASRADANVEMEEYLASHGYVVATVPQLGPSESHIDLGSSPQELALHADDFDFALQILRGLPFVDGRTFVAVGHSAGAEVSIELAFRHPEMKAVIGLDGSFGTKSGSRILTRLPGYQTDRKIRASLFDIRRSEGSQGVQLDLTAGDAIRWSHLYRKQFQGAYHGDFTEWGMVAFVAGIAMPPNPYGHTRQLGVDVNRAACHYVLDFLDYKLQGRKAALVRLRPLLQ